MREDRVRIARRARDDVEFRRLAAQRTEGTGRWICRTGGRYIGS